MGKNTCCLSAHLLDRGRCDQICPAEERRGNKYDGILLDPPKFKRDPKGEVWEVYKSLPKLLKACYQVMSGKPLFVIATVYAVKASAIHGMGGRPCFLPGYVLP